jgi:toxoflavin biosynthesis protein ToxC
MIRHSSPISGIDAAGSFVATAGYDNRVVLWNAENRVALAEARHDHLANQCRFSPSGELLATSGSDYSARLWTLPDLRLLTVLTDHKDDVETTVFDPEEKRVATASRDHMVRIFDLDGRLLHRMEGHTADVLSAEWTHGGQQLLTTSDDGTVRRWDTKQGRLLETMDLGGTETDTFAIVDDDVFVLGNDDGQLIVMRAGASPVPHPAHSAGIKRLAFDADSGLLLSCSYDRTLRFWRLTSEGIDLVQSTDVPAEVWMRSCARLDSTRWVFGTFGSSYATYDRSDDRWDLTGVEPTGGINCVVVDGPQVLTVGDSGQMAVDGSRSTDLGSCCNVIFSADGVTVAGGQLGTVFDVRTGNTLYQHHSPINCATAYQAADGRTEILLGTYTGEGVRLAVGLDGQVEYLGDVPLHDNAVKGVAVAEDVLFSVCATGAAAFHKIPDFTLVTEVPDAHARIANGAAALPDGRFVSVGRDLKLRIWSTTGKRVAAVPTPHENSIKCVAVDPDTGLVATGGYHGRVAVYDPSAGTWVTNRRPATSGISSLCPGKSPGSFLAASYDGNVYPIPVEVAND